MAIGIGHMVLQRVGTGADVGLVAMIAPGATQAAHLRHTAQPSPADLPAAPPPQPVAPPGDLPTAEYERPALSGEAPAEFALIDEFAETPDQPVVEPVASEPAPEPDQPSALPPDMPTMDASPGETPADIVASAGEIQPGEPAPEIKAAADEPASPAAAETPATTEARAPPSLPVDAAPWFDEPSPHPRRYPLRFMWQMDADGRFSISRDEFTHLIGVRTAAGFGRLWSEIAETFGLDPDGRVAKAIAARNTWSGITVQWPVDDGDRLPVELSGLPIYDGARNFIGYRGFGVCRDLDSLDQLDALRRHESSDDAATRDAVSALAAATDLPLPAAEPPAAGDAAASAAHPLPSASGDLETNRFGNPCGSTRRSAEERRSVSAAQRAESAGRPDAGGK